MKPHRKPESATSRTQFNVRLPDKLRRDIDRLAKISGRSRAVIAADALTDYVAWRIPQQIDLQKGLREADAGDLIDHETVMAKLDALIRKHEG